MKLDSPWFDRIRVAPKAERVETKRAAKERPCETPGCGLAGGFRAPKGRGREGQYWNFCFDHARAYNQSYNYFADMPEEAVLAWQRDSLTGHRPTWQMGVNSWGRGERGERGRTQQPPPPPRWDAFGAADPFEFFDDVAREEKRARAEREAREVRNVERKALDALGLEPGATREEIKARFKLLVKRLHPDANGGDRGTEDKLRAVIEAYNYLKQAGQV